MPLRSVVMSTTRASLPPSIVIDPTIVRGLRGLGYLDSAAAICALVENVIDAEASDVEILFETDDGAVTAIAVAYSRCR